MFSTKALKTQKLRWAFTALLSTIAGAMLAMGPVTQVGAAEFDAKRLAPIKDARLAGLGIQAPATQSRLAVRVNEGATHFNAADAYGPGEGIAVGDTLALGSNRPSAGEFGPAGYEFEEAADPGFESGFAGVSGLSDDSAFAVGWVQTDTTEALIEEYDGSAWTVAEAPEVPGWELLLGVDARAANDVYAVGLSQTSTLIEHFDGVAWSVVTAPVVSRGTLTAVAAIAADDVYAVGYYFDGPAIKTLVMHFDGNAWSVMASPNRGLKRNMLAALAVVSPTNIWAVGYYNGNGGRHKDRTLIEHFDGTKWSMVASPNLGNGSNALWAVEANGPRDIWAVGETRYGTLAVHFDGTSWTADPRTLQFTRAGDVLNGVVAFGQNDVYAVGGYMVNQFGATPQYRSLIHHFDGTSWENV